ncbi:MAG: hypothetical protein ABUL66_01970 [Verrucomicrobiota bacterium]
MQFLLIMGIGTLVAIWVVVNQPKPRGRKRRHEPDIISFEHLPANKPAWRGELGEVYSTDEFDYMRKMARHQDDPQHWPAPFPPPPLKRPAYETEYD